MNGNDPSITPLHGLQDLCRGSCRMLIWGSQQRIGCQPSSTLITPATSPGRTPHFCHPVPWEAPRPKKQDDAKAWFKSPLMVLWRNNGDPNASKAGLETGDLRTSEPGGANGITGERWVHDSCTLDLLKRTVLPLCWPFCQRQSGRGSCGRTGWHGHGTNRQTLM